MVIRQTISARRVRTLQIASVLTLLVGYTYLSWRQHQINPMDTTIPTWSQMWDGVLKTLAVNGSDHTRWLIADAMASGERLFLGLALGLAGAFTIGVAMGCLQSVGAFFEPLLALAASVPPTGMLAVMFVIFGFGLNMYVAMITFGVLPTLAQAIYLGTKDVQDEEIWKAYTLGASHMEVVWHVVVRRIAPKILDVICLQIGPAVVYLIAAEVICADIGFGYRIRLQAKLTHMDIAYPYLAIASGLTYLTRFTITKVREWQFPWFDQRGVS